MPKYTIGLDVGASKIAAGLVWESQVPKLIKLPTGTSREMVMQNIAKAIRVFINSKVKAIGVGIAGQIDQKKGVLATSPNLPFLKNVPLREILESQFKKSVVLENDANCFTLGEAVYGAGKKRRYVIGLTLGTGVGGGVVFDKKIYQGRDGLAGELGHMTIAENGFLCSCGQRGHLEAYASGGALEKMYYQFTGQRQTALQIEQLALRGERNAKRVVEIASNALAIGLANLINIFNPDIIVLGGGLVRAKIIILPAMIKARQAVAYPILKTTKIVPSVLGDKAAVLGAALVTNH